MKDAGKIKMQEERHRKSSLQLYLPLALLQGFERLACERMLETERKLHILTPLLWPSRCVFLVLLMLGSTPSGLSEGERTRAKALSGQSRADEWTRAKALSGQSRTDERTRAEALSGQSRADKRTRAKALSGQSRADVRTGTKALSGQSRADERPGQRAEAKMGVILALRR